MRGCLAIDRDGENNGLVTDESSLRCEEKLGEVHCYVSRKWSITHNHEWRRSWTLKETLSSLPSLRSEGATHATRGSVAKTPLFLEHLLIGRDNGRAGRFKVKSGRRWLGEKRVCPSESGGDLDPGSVIRDQG